MELSRRELIVGAASTAMLCGLGGVAQALGSNENLLRPPGGQDEDRFSGLCIKCDRCRSVCPENCIGLAHLEDGLLVARSPKMDFHTGRCTFCDRCIDVCPTGALLPFDEDTQKVGIAVIVKGKCVAWKNPGSCQKCKDACDYHAIDIVDGIPKVDEDKCNGCGACEKVCPAMVYTSLSSGSDRGIVVVPVDIAHRMEED